MSTTDSNRAARLDEARRILSTARASLGDDLGGFSPIDLLADNMSGSLDDLRSLVEEIDGGRPSLFGERAVVDGDEE